MSESKKYKVNPNPLLDNPLFKIVCLTSTKARFPNAVPLGIPTTDGILSGFP